MSEATFHQSPQGDASDPFDRQRQQRDRNYAQNLIVAVLSAFSVSVEVFLRRKFGERYFNGGRFVLAFLAFAAVLWGVGQWARARGAGFLADSIGFAFPHPMTAEEIAQARANLPAFFVDRVVRDGGLFFSVVPFLYLAFFGLGVGHLVATWQRNRRGEQWHSYSFGVSHLSPLIGERVGPFTIDDWGLYRFIEPGAVLLVGAVLWFLPVPQVLAGWFLLAGAVLLVKNHLLYRQERNRVLDLIDARIEAEYMDVALEGRDKETTAGFTLVRPPAGALRPVERPQAQAAPGDFGDVLADTLGQQPQAPRIEAANDNHPQGQQAAA